MKRQRGEGSTAAKTVKQSEEAREATEESELLARQRPAKSQRVAGVTRRTAVFGKQTAPSTKISPFSLEIYLKLHFAFFSQTTTITGCSHCICNLPALQTKQRCQHSFEMRQAAIGSTRLQFVSQIKKKKIQDSKYLAILIEDCSFRLLSCGRATVRVY